MARTMERMTDANRHSGLPTGYVTRAGSMDDLPAAVEICELNERRVIGDTTGFARHFRIFWTLPGSDIAEDLRVIENAEGAVVGFVNVRAERPYVQARVTGYVHPDHFGRGLGTFLAKWAEGRAREVMEQAPDGVRTSMHNGVVAGDELAGKLLSDHGFEITRHFVLMVTDFDGPPQPPVWPEGVELRPVDWREHGRLISSADNEIFQDHWGFVPKSDDDAYEHMSHWYEKDPEVDPTLWFVAWAGDQIAGVSLCWPKGDDDPNKGYIGILGVRRQWRGKGLGLALLRYSFGEFYKRGQRQAALHADAENITGALRLYMKAGMHIHRQIDNFEKVTRDGKDLAVRTLPE